MKEKIYYRTEEGQDFQEMPHVALLLSSQAPEEWQVDLRWREDKDPTDIDAEHHLADGLSFSDAIKSAKEWGELLNVPIAKYEDDSIEILHKPKELPNKDQQINLKLIMYSNKTQRFRVH